MKKKVTIGIITIIIIIISMTFISISKEKSERDGVYFKNKTYTKEISPISKSTALNIIKAEYGDFVSIKENEIKKDGDKYKFELFTTHEDEGGTHKESMGVHEIDMYTGEMKIDS